MTHMWHLTPALTFRIIFLMFSPLSVALFFYCYEFSSPFPLCISLLAPPATTGLTDPSPSQAMPLAAEQMVGRGDRRARGTPVLHPLPQPHSLGPELLRCDKAQVDAYRCPAYLRY